MTDFTRRWTSCWPAALCLFLRLAAPTVLPAQIVRGTVIDSIMATPLKGVTVDLMSPQSVVGKAVTDDSGHFSIRVPVSTSYRFRAQQIGYRNYLSRAVPIDASRDATVTLLLVSLPVALEPISVSASSQIYLQNSGFYERKRTDPGYFMDPDAMIAAASKALQTADVLAGIPGITMLSGGGSRGIRIPQFSARPGFGCDNGPRIFLDNHLMNPQNDPIDVNTIHPSDLLAAEIYRHVSEVPLKFGGNDAVCGAIVLWTKH
jgi:hypothetical protein